MPINSARLFKGTVILLAFPAILFLVIASVLIIVRLSGGWPLPGIASFTFAVTRLELVTVAVIVLVVFIFLGVLVKGVARRYRRRQSRLNS